MKPTYKYGSYALAAAALGVAPEAEGAIIWFDNPDTILTSDTNFDLDGDTVDDFLVDFTPGDALVGWTALGSNESISLIGGEDIAALTLGFEIGGTLPDGFKYSGGGGRLLEDKSGLQGQWANDLNSPALVGFIFQIGGNNHAGWARVGTEVSEENDIARAIVYDWAYNDVANESILAGDTGEPPQSNEVPEPSSLALMAMGAAGIAALKLRKRA